MAKMNLYRKQDYNNLLTALSDASELSIQELRQSRNHDATSWVHLGIYIAHDMGLTLKKAADMFSRHYTTAHAAVSKTKAMIERGDPLVTQWDKHLREIVKENALHK